MEYFFGILFFVSPFVAIYLFIKLKKNRSINDGLSSRISNLTKALAEEEDLRVDAEASIKSETIKQNEISKELQQARKELEKYAPIFDVEKEALSIKVQAKSILKKATEKLEEAGQRVDRVRREAKEKADKVIAAAEEKAEQIAGEAYAIKQTEKQLKKAVTAMRNTIKGYGAEYLMPPDSLLDELADQYDFKEAGEKLKEARVLVRDFVKNEYAATCDYAEENRKKTAINFVLDAFNGKVATILSKVKHDNYGKLQQQIIDAFSLVNNNGSAFRNARISPEYLAARQDELKWAVATQELALRDREEQKRIKEELREEAKAAREYEKAVRDAEKEEKMLQKAMAEARKELGNASEEQKAQFEMQLKELEAKLAEAEEKNQRAISMAQQTKRGHVYVISNEGSFGEKVIKIGLTRRLEPLDRVKELGDASVPFAFDVHALMFSENAPALESELHRQFDQYRVNKINKRKEFFNVNIASVKDLTSKLGIDTKWTLAAEAREYRESLELRGLTSIDDQIATTVDGLAAA
ncbi:DUF4041 domain-containing protein [Desulfotalea psychrophila]|nr:DUF4041 domain-containing protein [Desulfotalea psychrophila]